MLKQTLVNGPDAWVDMAVAGMVKLGFKGECSVIKGFMREASKQFDPSCVVHDALYQTGGSRKDRCNADLGFFKRAVAGVMYMDNKKVLWFVPAALVWLVGIRLFGWMFFDYRETPRTMQQVLTFNRIHHNKGIAHLPLIRRFLWTIYYPCLSKVRSILTKRK